MAKEHVVRWLDSVLPLDCPVCGRHRLDYGVNEGGHVVYVECGKCHFNSDDSDWLEDKTIRVTWHDHEPKPGEGREDLRALLNRGDWSVPWVRREVAALFEEAQGA